MAGNFRVWWDGNAGRLCWSGRGDLDYVPPGYFHGATRNHVVSHGTAMRMLVNRINEAYLPIPGNQFPLQQNIDLILAAIGIMTVNLPAGCEIMNARRAILNNIGPNGSVDAICKGITTLEYYILNWPYNMRYGFSDVNSQIGDCLDLPANQIAYAILPAGTMVRLQYNAAAVPLNDWAYVRCPASMSQADRAIRCLLNSTDWKDWEIQLMGGMAHYGGITNFFLASSTDSLHFDLHGFTAPDDRQHYYGFGIPLANPVTYMPEWFLFQRTNELTYTAMR